jgi:putative FmdB family regulatory protein
MPTYTFSCLLENDGCGHTFEYFCNISDYDAVVKVLTCPECDNNKLVRDFQADSLSTNIVKSDDEIKLGHLAKRNTDRFSDDQKAELYKKHNAYKYTEPTKELPKGMRRMGPPGQRTFSEHQMQHHYKPKRKPSIQGQKDG